MVLVWLVGGATTRVVSAVHGMGSRGERGGSSCVGLVEGLLDGLEDAFDVCCDFVVPAADYFVAGAV